MARRWIVETSTEYCVAWSPSAGSDAVESKTFRDRSTAQAFMNRIASRSSGAAVLFSRRVERGAWRVTGHRVQSFGPGSSRGDSDVLVTALTGKERRRPKPLELVAVDLKEGRA